jgi:hypothetical protein
MARRSIWIIIATVVLMARPASSYMVSPASSLDQIANQADIIVKATAVLEWVVQDDWFKEYRGFEVRETTMNVVSVIKGQDVAAQIYFRHYAPKSDQRFFEYSPQTYSFTLGRTYLVFATKADPPTFRQIRTEPTLKEDGQGTFLVADDKPHTGKTVAEAVWKELVCLARSESASDAIYAIRQLDDMSGRRIYELHDFDRAASLQVIAERIKTKDEAISGTAIFALGSDSPYIDDAQAVF